MEVDLDACLRSFRDAFNMFKSHPSEDQMKNLEREGNVRDCFITFVFINLWRLNRLILQNVFP